MTISEFDANLSSKKSPRTRLNEVYEKIVKSADPSKPLVCNPVYSVSNESMRKLRPGTWLNDELLNAYAFLVNSRIVHQNRLAASEGQEQVRMMCLNTYFMT